MSKKLENNGLWESSRMMLPQHKDALRSRHINKPFQQTPPTSKELDLMRDYILLPIMHSIVVKKSREVENSTNTLRTLYSKVAHALAKNIELDLSKIKKCMIEKNIRVFEDEKDEYMIHYRYTYNEFEDRFTIAKDYMKAQISVRIGRYADKLIETLYGDIK